MALRAEEAAALIDHTQLKPDAGAESIRRLCSEAKLYGFASVCVHSGWVPLCKEQLDGAPVKVGSVVASGNGVGSGSPPLLQAASRPNSAAKASSMRQMTTGMPSTIPMSIFGFRRWAAAWSESGPGDVATSEAGVPGSGESTGVLCVGEPFISTSERY